MIAITGAAGFIGSVLVWMLRQRGEQALLAVDTLPDGSESPNLRPLGPVAYAGHERFLDGLERGEWPDLRAVLHLGACSSTTELDEDYLARNNVAYSQRLCSATLARGARFIHASSAATYGDGAHGYSDAHDRIALLEPLNPYGRSKQAFDLWALAHGHLDHIVALKYFNVFGPNEWHKGAMRSMVCKGFEQVRDTGVLRLFRSDRPDFADGGQQRDFIYVKDAAAMTLWFLDHPGTHGIFNIGTGEAQSWNRLGAAIFAAMGRPARIEYIAMPPELRGRYQYFTQAEMDKLRAAGCTLPMTPLEDAVAEYVQRHLVPHRHLGEG
jgi:ADP-L-glycero-D-manno-heptose 6-epimerase